MKKQYGFYNYAIKMRFYPNHQQVKILLANIHTSRYLYNQLLANSFMDSLIAKVNRKYPLPESVYQKDKHGKEKSN